MKLRIIFERLEEYDRLSFAGAPDDSGIRGQGVVRTPYSRMQNFPYDRDDQYGEPNVYDRGSSNFGGLHKSLTPKDDEHFSLSLLDLEEIIREVMGDPTSPSKGNSSNMGSAIPGMGGSWANNPAKPWDEPDEIEEAPLTIDTSPPDSESIPNSNFPDFRSETDDDLENRLDRIYGREDNTNFVTPPGASFADPDFHFLSREPYAIVNKNLTARGLYGLMSKESAWDRVTSMSRKKRENF